LPYPGPPYAGQVIRLLLADDEAMIRVGVRTILTTDPGMEVVAEAADGRDAVALTLRYRPDIALLDIRMPRLDGLGAAKELRRVAPGTSLMMLTTFSEDEFIDRALGLGVHGFVLKSGDPRELIAGIRAVSAGGAYLSPEVAHRIITHLHGSGRLDRAASARTRLECLTDRERDVVGLVGAGLSNAEIAARLHVVEGTVKAHVSTVLARLGLRNRVQLAILAYEAGLLDGD
jgi:DNA-binding NarL/FixJ family response regulator